MGDITTTNGRHRRWGGVKGGEAIRKEGIRPKTEDQARRWGFIESVESITVILT